MASPRLEINLEKIGQNAKLLVDYYQTIGICLIGVTKGVCGNPYIANTLLRSGIKILGDSRILNLENMKRAGITTQFIMLRSPLLSELEYVINHCSISHNTEFSIIKKLSQLSIQKARIHKIILMIELGDLREGILPDDLEPMVARIMELKGVKIVGIGTNLACFAGIKPDEDNMAHLAALAISTEVQLGYKLDIVSGGNSANFQWSKTIKGHTPINYLRLGESIFLGCDPINRKPIPYLHTDAFTLIAEVIESGVKPSLPRGTVHQNATGGHHEFKNQGSMAKAILALGIQDVIISGLKPRSNTKILGASSDHLVIDSKKKFIEVGDELEFDLDYSALLSAMSSPYVSKICIPQ